MLPIAMAVAGSTGTSVVRLAIRAPAKIAAQARRLSMSTAQSASPDGGQAGLTCSTTSAARNPSFAAAT